MVCAPAPDLASAATPGSCEGSSNDRTGSSACGATATGYQIDAHPTSLLVVQYGRLCALCLHEATSWIPPTAAGKAPNLSCFVVFTHAILLILILCLFACSIGYIHDGRQAGAEQASPHNNIVMSCLFNPGKKILGGFAIWKLIFSLVSSLIILATLRPCQIMPLTVRSYIRQHSKLSLVLYYDMPVNKDQRYVRLDLFG